MVGDGHTRGSWSGSSESVEGAGRSWTIGPPHFACDGADRTEQLEADETRWIDCEQPLVKLKLVPGSTLRPGRLGDEAVKGRGELTRKGSHRLGLGPTGCCCCGQREQDVEGGRARMQNARWKEWSDGYKKGVGMEEWKEEGERALRVEG